MQVYDEASALAAAIRESDVCREYRRLKEEVEGNETNRALIREYKKLQMQLQMAAVTGASSPEEDGRRFQQIGALLFAQPAVSRFLLCEMRLQQMMADIYKILGDAAGLELPGVSG
ncbi:MAG: YlbF family regulator [Clostridia bacterium]|nr:YlbF family regulator [Clostridia bacterium]